MSWFTRFKHIATRILSVPGDASYAELEAAGFQRVYYMGEDGRSHVAHDLVGWWFEDEGRCWRFKATVYDPDSWPHISGALFIPIQRPGRLLVQAVISEHGCWWANESLVLHPCTVNQLFERLTDHPYEWNLAAKYLGLGTIKRWFR